MATIRDVAKLAGVSSTTVSAALSGNAPVSAELKRRVWEAVKQAGYRPDPIAQNLRRGSTTTVGFICPDIAAPWASHMARAMQTSLREQGYNMLLASNDDDTEREMRDIALMIDHRVAGVIIAPTSLGEGYAGRLIEALRCPAVVVDRCVAPDKFDVVADDNALGGTLLANYVTRLGHRRIGMLVGRASIPSSSERFEAFRAALARSGVSLDPMFCRHGIHTVEGAYRAAQDLMSLPERPTALVCISQHQMHGLMAGLANMGLLAPRDVSVLGFDGFNPPEGWSPTITCLIQDTQTICDLSVELLARRIAERDNAPPQIRRVPPRMKIGTSSAAPPTGI